MKNGPPRITVALMTLALGFGSMSIGAQPPENRGKPDGHPGKHDQHAEKDYRKDKKDHKNHERDDDRYQSRNGSNATPETRNITIEEAVIREIFRDQRDYVSADDSLPPGIRKNLARGKPLPPGIAKKFDSRVQSRLPSYPGYDWRQVGTDAVLINTTTGIIETIIDSILR